MKFLLQLQELGKLWQKKKRTITSVSLSESVIFHIKLVK